MPFTDFENEILEKLSLIPKGRVTTYAQLAKAIGRPNACRAVGNAIHKNPDAPVVPCHRVVKSDGRIGGYAFGPDKKAQILRKEGVVVKGDKIIDFKDKFFQF